MDANHLTSAGPKISATLTVRIIKSFTYRTERSLVLHGINLEQTTVGQLKEMAGSGMAQTSYAPWGEAGPDAPLVAIRTQPGWKPYASVCLGQHIVDLFPRPAHSLVTQIP
jgi:hypothetical protein